MCWTICHDHQLDCLRNSLPSNQATNPSRTHRHSSLPSPMNHQKVIENHFITRIMALIGFLMFHFPHIESDSNCARPKTFQPHSDIHPTLFVSMAKLPISANNELFMEIFALSVCLESISLLALLITCVVLTTATSYLSAACRAEIPHYSEYVTKTVAWWNCNWSNVPAARKTIEIRPGSERLSWKLVHSSSLKGELTLSFQPKLLTSTAATILLRRKT